LKRIYLGLAIHNHQPLGNFPWVFDDSYQRAYLPMLQALRRHPSISVSMHYSGCLLDWIEEHHPEFLDLLEMLVSRGQVEIMGGGYYEPILSMIPDIDKSGQIEMMSGYIQQRFGFRPHGFWLTERVWEPSLAMSLSGCGIEWTLVDDTAFKMVGMSEKELFSYFTTEEQGRYIKIFPISKYLRYAIPWHDVHDVIAHLKESASESEERIAVLGDDGEKFGVWPQSAELCWEAGWIDDFFSAIENNKDWLSTIKLGDYAQSHSPAGRVYLPCSSYDEMLEWSLPAGVSESYTELKHKTRDESGADILNNMFSGYWRNFLVKYPEINRMHKKMLAVSNKVQQARSMKETDCGKEYLWKAQCNCPYWHGVFGGVYLPDIRMTAFNNLIKAENCADTLTDADRRYCWQQIDFDGDGQEEIIIEGCDLNLYISPAEGGSIFEWDLREQACNVLCTVSRKPESYHRALTSGESQRRHGNDSGVHSIHDGIKIKDNDVVDWLIYDEVPRSSMIDRFLDFQVSMLEYRRNEYKDRGDFAGRPYRGRVVPSVDALSIELEREGTLNSSQGPCKLMLHKSITLGHNDGSLGIGYRFINTGNAQVDNLFTGEWNINLLGGGHNEAAYYRVNGRDMGDPHLDSSGEITDVERLILGNSYLGFELELEVERPLTIWRYPVESISNSEAGLEKVYQCSCLVMLLPISIKPGRAVSFNYIWRVMK